MEVCVLNINTYKIPFIWPLGPQSQKWLLDPFKSILVLSSDF